jgi:Uma2 family endonuclease
MNPIGRDHAFSVSEINRHFAVLWDRAALWVQNPIIVDEENELMPDFSLIRLDVYRAGEIPKADAVHLVVEVAQTSQAYDQEIKAPLYARGGIPEYWLIDTRKRMMLVHTEPSPRGYRQSRILNLSDIVSPQAFPDFQVKVADLLPTHQQD